MPWWNPLKFPYTAFAFLIGAGTSMICGLIGMKIATYTNVRVTYACGLNKGYNKGLTTAYYGGQVMGFALVGIALLILEIIIFAYRPSVLDS